MKLKQILVPVAIGVGIMLAIMGLIELNNILGFPYRPQLSAKDIAIVGSLVAVAISAFFGVILPKDDEESMVRMNKSS